jgi:hypothetical protein
MVTVPEILAAMGSKIATVPGIRAAYYPPPKTIPSGPVVVLYWGSDVDTEISNDLSQRMWLPAVKAQILTPMKGNTPAEFGVIDNLITPIVDLFDTGPATKVLPTLGGKVDRLQVVRVRPTLQVDYAGSLFYAAELFWSIKYHRRAGG